MNYKEESLTDPFLIPYFLFLISYFYRMKHILLYSLLLTLFACNSSDAPDVSNIKADLEIVRFENDFFAIDTNNVTASMQALSVKHGGFVNDFTTNILGIIPTTDSSAPAVS